MGCRSRIGIVTAALTAAVLAADAAGAAVVTDVLTIGTVSVSLGTGQVGVTIYIQDNTGTLIGRDQPMGFRISGFGMQVTYGPNPCIDTPDSPSQRVDLTGGILASQFADINSRPKVANTLQSWVYSSAETNGLIPFTAAAAPGDQIGTMVFNLTGCSAGTIALVIKTSGGPVHGSGTAVRRERTWDRGGSFPKGLVRPAPARLLLGWGGHAGVTLDGSSRRYAREALGNAGLSGGIGGGRESHPKRFLDPRLVCRTLPGMTRGKRDGTGSYQKTTPTLTGTNVNLSFVCTE